MPTTLYAAASAGDLAGVDRRLLHEGVDVVTETGNTALHGAAAAGGLRMCSYLLHSKGANPTIQNATGVCRPVWRVLQSAPLQRTLTIRNELLSIASQNK